MNTSVPEAPTGQWRWNGMESVTSRWDVPASLQDWAMAASPTGSWQKDTRERPSSWKSGQHRKSLGGAQPMEFQQQALTDSALLQGDLNPHSGDGFLHAFGTSGSLRKLSHFPLHSNKQTKHFCSCSKVGCNLVSHTETSERRRNSTSLPQSELTWTPRQAWI